MLLMVDTTTFEPFIMCSRGMIRNKNLSSFLDIFLRLRSIAIGATVSGPQTSKVDSAWNGGIIALS